MTLLISCDNFIQCSLVIAISTSPRSITLQISCPILFYNQLCPICCLYTLMGGIVHWSMVSCPGATLKEN